MCLKGCDANGVLGVSRTTVWTEDSLGDSQDWARGHPQGHDS